MTVSGNYGPVANHRMVAKVQYFGYRTFNEKFAVTRDVRSTITVKLFDFTNLFLMRRFAIVALEFLVDSNEILIDILTYLLTSWRH